MSDLLPEKIWYQHRTEPHNLPSYNAPPAGLDTVEYIRSDLMDAKIESLQRELAEKHDEVLALEAAAITPEMRAVLKRAFALAREVEESELAEDLCGILIETDPYRNPHLNTGGMGDE